MQPLGLVGRPPGAEDHRQVVQRRGRLPVHQAEGRLVDLQRRAGLLLGLVGPARDEVEPREVGPGVGRPGPVGAEGLLDDRPGPEESLLGLVGPAALQRQRTEPRLDRRDDRVLGAEARLVDRQRPEEERLGLIQPALRVARLAEVEQAPGRVGVVRPEFGLLPFERAPPEGFGVGEPPAPHVAAHQRHQRRRVARAGRRAGEPAADLVVERRRPWRWGVVHGRRGPRSLIAGFGRPHLHYNGHRPPRARVRRRTPGGGPVVGPDLGIGWPDRTPAEGLRPGPKPILRKLLIYWFVSVFRTVRPG